MVGLKSMTPGAGGFWFICFLEFLFIYLAAPGLSCCTNDLQSQHVGSSFLTRNWTWAPALGMQSLSHCTTCAFWFDISSAIYLVVQRVKSLTAMWESWVLSLGQEDPLEKEMPTHSSILAWKIPWMEEFGRLQAIGLQRVGHDWATSLTHSLIHSLTLCHVPAV